VGVDDVEEFVRLQIGLPAIIQQPEVIGFHSNHGIILAGCEIGITGVFPS